MGYLALSEPAVLALARVLFVAAKVDVNKVPTGDLEENDFPRLTCVAGKLACSPLVFSDGDVSANRITQTTRQFIEDSQLNCLVVDDPDVPDLWTPGLLSASASLRVRMELREAVRGSRVELYLPG